MGYQQHIAIVGGGMVGMSLALMLSKEFSSLQSKPLSRNPPGISISLIEKFPLRTQKNDPWLQSSFDARSTVLSAGSMQLLRRIDCELLLKKYAEPILDIHISDRGHYFNTVLHAHDYAVEALGYVIENAKFGEYLLQQLQDSHVHCIAPATVQTCQFTHKGAVLVLEQEQIQKQLSVDLVVIADGSDSPLQKSLAINNDLITYQQSAVISNIILAAPHKQFAYEHFTRQGPLALLPLGDFDGAHCASLVWVCHAREANALMQLSNMEFIKTLQTYFGYRVGHILRVGQRYTYPLRLFQAKEQIRSHVVVLGDAAHVLHPVAGQGFNLSLRDAATLANVLVKASINHQTIGEYKTLKKYVQQREYDQNVTIALTDVMVKMFSSHTFSLSILRQLGLLTLQVFPIAKKILTRQMMGYYHECISE